MNNRPAEPASETLALSRVLRDTRGSGKIFGIGFEFKERGVVYRMAVEIEDGDSNEEVATQLGKLATAMRNPDSIHWAVGRQALSGCGKVINEMADERRQHTDFPNETDKP